MSDLIDRHLENWTKTKSSREARIAVFNHVRDIPYRVLPELNHPQNYKSILEVNAGSCTPKHLLMAEMYRRLGLDVLLIIYPYCWAAFEELYPPELRPLARAIPPVNHLTCNVLIHGRYRIVDATVDPPLNRIGLPVNECWDGESDTLLPVPPEGETEIYHPCEALLMPTPRLGVIERSFYSSLNEYFDRVRNGLL